MVPPAKVFQEPTIPSVSSSPKFTTSISVVECDQEKAPLAANTDGYAVLHPRRSPRFTIHSQPPKEPVRTVSQEEGMSVIRFRNEDALIKSGHQLDPVTGEIAKIPQGVVWEMTDEEFAAHAASFNAAQCVEMIREAHKQVARCFKRGAEWYYAAGRWLAWVKKKTCTLVGLIGWHFARMNVP